VISRRNLFTQFRYGTYAAPVPAALVVPAAGQPDAADGTSPIARSTTHRRHVCRRRTRCGCPRPGRAPPRLRGDGVQLHSGDVHAAGGEGDEVPGSGLQHPSAGEAELPHACPDRQDQVGVGVVALSVLRAAAQVRRASAAWPVPPAPTRVPAVRDQRPQGQRPTWDQRASSACPAAVAGRPSR